jgi:hypothetical protein
MKDKAILAEKYAEGKSSSSVFREAHIRDFLAGFNSAEKEIAKIIKDLKNKYGSWLVEAQTRKLSKIVDQDEVLKLKAKLEVLQELENKLGI